MCAYENALSELLTGLDAVESYAPKAVGDVRKELVLQIARELVELEEKDHEGARGWRSGGEGWRADR